MSEPFWEYFDPFWRKASVWRLPHTQVSVLWFFVSPHCVEYFYEKITSKAYDVIKWPILGYFGPWWKTASVWRLPHTQASVLWFSVPLHCVEHFYEKIISKAYMLIKCPFSGYSKGSVTRLPHIWPSVLSFSISTHIAQHFCIKIISKAMCWLNDLFRGILSPRGSKRPTTNLTDLHI